VADPGVCSLAQLPPQTSVAPHWTTPLWCDCAHFWCLSNEKQRSNKTVLSKALRFLNFRIYVPDFYPASLTELYQQCNYFVIMLLLLYSFLSRVSLLLAQTVLDSSLGC